MEGVNLIALAIPVFFAMIGLELLVARWQGRRLHRLNDAITDLSCGIGSQVVGVFLKVALLAVYVWIYEHAAILTFSPTAVGTWVVATLGVDLAYYAWHRASHRVNLVWATHVPHHQSQDYNLAVALRQAWFSSVTSAPFYWPLAILGVPPVVFFASSALNTLYQFWIHTETVRSLGPLEWVLNTPAHHRVHHGINPRYIDKNYAGFLIVWDRLFGTFEPESEPAVYGTVKPFRSWNPIWANFDHLAWLWRESRAAPRWIDGVRLWFAPPEWTPEGRPPLAPAQPVHPDTFTKWDRPIARGLGPYVVAHFVLVTLGVVALLYVADTAEWATLVVLGTWIVWTTAVWGALFDARPWGPTGEFARLAAMVAGGVTLGWLVPALLPLAVATVTVAAASALWFARLQPALEPLTTPQGG